MNDFQYFEVCIGAGPSEDPAHDFWMCIKAARPHVPDRDSLSGFLSKDLADRPGTSVLGVYMIDEATARGCYDFDNEPDWPVFGLDGKEDEP